MTDSNVKFNRIINGNDENPTSIMNEIEKELTKVKFKAFDKVTVRKELKRNKELKNLQKKREQLSKRDNIEHENEIKAIDSEITNKILAAQRNNLEKELKHLKSLAKCKGKTAAIFNLKDKVIGNKKSDQEATTMKHPVTHEVLSRRSDIKKAALAYCVDLLDNRKPKAGYEDEVLIKDLIHETRMKEHIEDDIEFSRKIFNNSLNILRKKNKDKYKFILQGGNDLKLALFKLFDYEVFLYCILRNSIVLGGGGVGRPVGRCTPR